MLHQPHAVQSAADSICLQLTLQVYVLPRGVVMSLVVALDCRDDVVWGLNIKWVYDNSSLHGPTSGSLFVERPTEDC